MKKKLLAVFLFSATTMLCAQTLQTSNKYFEVGNFKEVHNPAWGVTDDPWCINDHTFIYDKKKEKMACDWYNTCPKNGLYKRSWAQSTSYFGR